MMNIGDQLFVNSLNDIPKCIYTILRNIHETFMEHLGGEAPRRKLLMEA